MSAVAGRLRGAQVVGATCLSVRHPIFAHRAFDVCIVDEASQIKESVCIGPLRAAALFVLVGDHHQLPPLVVSRQAKAGGLGVSLFKRLSEAHPVTVAALTAQYRMNADIQSIANTLVYGGALRCGSEAVATGKYVLPAPERVPALLVAAAAVSVSEGAGVSVGDKHRPCQSLPTHTDWLARVLSPDTTVCFLDIDEAAAEEQRVAAAVLAVVASAPLVSSERGGNGTASATHAPVTSPSPPTGNDSSASSSCGQSSPLEAAAVATIVAGILAGGGLPAHIGVISPFRAQLRLLRSTLEEELVDRLGATDSLLAALEVETVDRYQGRDKPVVLLSLTKYSLGGDVGTLLTDIRRLNVGVTRAKFKLVIVGSRGTLLAAAAAAAAPSSTSSTAPLTSAGQGRSASLSTSQGEAAKGAAALGQLVGLVDANGWVICPPLATLRVADYDFQQFGGAAAAPIAPLEMAGAASDCVAMAVDGEGVSLQPAPAEPAAVGPAAAVAGDCALTAPLEPSQDAPPPSLLLRPVAAVVEPAMEDVVAAADAAAADQFFASFAAAGPPLLPPSVVINGDQQLQQLQRRPVGAGDFMLQVPSSAAPDSSMQAISHRTVGATLPAVSVPATVLMAAASASDPNCAGGTTGGAGGDGDDGDDWAMMLEGAGADEFEAQARASLAARAALPSSSSSASAPVPPATKYSLSSSSAKRMAAGAGAVARRHSGGGGTGVAAVSAAKQGRMSLGSSSSASASSGTVDEGSGGADGGPAVIMSAFSSGKGSRMSMSAAAVQRSKALFADADSSSVTDADGVGVAAAAVPSGDTAVGLGGAPISRRLAGGTSSGNKFASGGIGGGVNRSRSRLSGGVLLAPSSAVAAAPVGVDCTLVSGAPSAVVSSLLSGGGAAAAAEMAAAATDASSTTGVAELATTAALSHALSSALPAAVRRCWLWRGCMLLQRGVTPLLLLMARLAGKPRCTQQWTLRRLWRRLHTWHITRGCRRHHPPSPHPPPPPLPAQLQYRRQYLSQ